MTTDELRYLAKWLEEQATAVDTLCGRTPENLSRNNLRAAARVVAAMAKLEELPSDHRWYWSPDTECLLNGIGYRYTTAIEAIEAAQ